MSGEHYDTAERLSLEAESLLRFASGPEQTAMFQKQACGLAAVAQVHALLALSERPLPVAEEPEKFPWDDPS